MPSSPPGGTCGIYLVEKRPVQYWNELRSNNAFLGPLLNEQWNFFHVCPLVAGIVNFAIFLLRPDVGGIFHQVGRNIRFRPVISTSFQSLFEYLHISKKKYWTDKSPRWDLVFEKKIKGMKETTWPGERYTFRADAISLSTHAAVRPLKMKRHETFVPSRHHIIFEPCISIRNEHFRFEKFSFDYDLIEFLKKLDKLT